MFVGKKVEIKAGKEVKNNFRKEGNILAEGS